MFKLNTKCECVGELTQKTDLKHSELKYDISQNIGKLPEYHQEGAREPWSQPITTLTHHPFSIRKVNYC